MCNAYYIIITVYSRQAFFEYFFIFSKSTRYCTFSVFLSFTPYIRLIKLLFFYQFYSLSNQYFHDKSWFVETKRTKPRNPIHHICDFSRGVLNARLSLGIQHLLRDHKYGVGDFEVSVFGCWSKIRIYAVWFEDSSKHYKFSKVHFPIIPTIVQKIVPQVAFSNFFH